MIPIVSPWKRGQYAGTPAQMAALRADFSTYIYPTGLPATLPDSIEDPYAGDIVIGAGWGCASMRMFVADAPGGRAGGSAIRVWHLRPSAARANKCLLLMAGHLDPALGWPSVHCEADGSSPIISALALGMDVLVADMPGCGQQPVPQVVVMNSVPTTVSQPDTHDYRTAVTDGGPNPMRIFFDHLIRAVNQMESDYPGIAFCLAGHSGGGITASQLGILDARFRHVAIYQGQIPRYADIRSQQWITLDLEQARNQPLYTHGPAGDYGNIFRLCASVPNRRTMVCSGLVDGTFPIASWPDYYDWTQGLDENVREGGSSAWLYQMPAGGDGHSPNAAEITAWVADMRATMDI